MSEKKFTCVLGKDYHIINNNVDNMTYYLQDGNDVVLVINLLNKLYEENEQLKQEIKQYWKCRDKWKQEAKELKKEADYFERKKCEYWNRYNEAHSDRIILKKENEKLHHLKVLANAFIVEKGLELEFVKWCKEEEKLYAQEILRLNNLLKQYQSQLDLGGDY